MGTEDVSDRYRGLDIWPDEEILESLFEAQLTAVVAVRPALPALAAAARAMSDRLAKPEGRLFLVGAGASGRLSIQDGIELTPTFSFPAERIIYLLAGGDKALTGSAEGAEDDADKGASLIDEHEVSPADVVVGVAASGTTPYTVAAVEAARRSGAATIAMANNPKSPLLQVGEHAILLDTGAEPVAGSTRMKAGTAQKIALNLLSTLAMIRLGGVFDGMMVDVQMTNAKLRERGRRMVARIAGCDQDAAAEALSRTGNRVKAAVLVARGLDEASADTYLANAGGRLRQALERLDGFPAETATNASP
ncbi:MAG: N-acetylmuramic acid 6-phosphate etherase [Pseudomonadota bacterium]